ncbi:gluconokinase, GntK/IdnK-type [Spirillospora sp. NPDC029432]|uniref:gluconokinase, GntK/IdnK-type n=1 Tax=Spirillospora sp. NPDC029432 TaxID=3154599 RepID=UPI0034530B65
MDGSSPPAVIVVVGVSGSGKTTIGEGLAARLGWDYAEADDFHPAANIEKMSAGIPLTDEDRLPWLRAIAAWIEGRVKAGVPGVASCSALKRTYRELLTGGDPRVRPVFLDGERDVIAERMAARTGHFFKPEMLDGQLREFEPAGPDERALTVPITRPPAETVTMILDGLGVDPAAAAFDVDAWRVPDAERAAEPLDGPERPMLQGMLDYHRATLRLKCAGLSARQLAEVSVPPSTMTLLGLIRHLTFVERIWFRIRFAGQPVKNIYVTPDHWDADFEDLSPGRAPAELARLVEECRRADNAVRGASLDDTFTFNGARRSLRWLYLHMIEEYARHNGHADLLRERIDGATGA